MLQICYQANNSSNFNHIYVKLHAKGFYKTIISLCLLGQIIIHINN